MHAQREAGATVRVLTLNVYGLNAGWPVRRSVIRKGLARLAPDLVALQETVVRDNDDQVTDLLGAGWHVAHAADPDGARAGVSIASRYPIASLRELNLPMSSPDPEFHHASLIAAIDVPPPVGRVLFVNHFPEASPPRERDRERPAVAVARCIEDLVGEDEPHVILAGDLDAEPDAASLRFLTGKQSLEGVSVCYRSAWEWGNPGRVAQTYTMRNALMADHNEDWPFSRIDHIFVRCGNGGLPTLFVESCDLAFADPVDGMWASDHIGIFAVLAVRPAAG